jgi:CelD/BcsL family acetyltransferase involved in cellulose biosynthesis
MELEGAPFAAEFQMAGADVTYAYLGGMSADLQDCSPGQVIQVAILKQCISQRQRAFDFLRGDESYKAHWAVQERRCRDYRIVPQRHTAQLRHQMWLAKDTMKQWIRAGLHVAGVH